MERRHNILATKGISIFLTVIIISLLFLAGPARAFTLEITASQNQFLLGQEISFVASLNIDSGEILPVDYLELNIGNEVACRFRPDGQALSGCSGLNIVEINHALFTEGNRTGNFSGIEYNFGYGYGYGGNAPQTLKYNITLNSNILGSGVFATKLKLSMLDSTSFEIIGEDIAVTEQSQNLTIFSPVQNAVYTDKAISFDVLYGGIAKDLRYNDNGQGFKLLCKKCFSYEQTRQFTEGFHEITFRAINNNGEETIETVSFLVDTQEPNIKHTSPVRGFTSGKFFIEFKELHPTQLILHYGQEANMNTKEVNLDNCYERGAYTDCNAEADLSQFNGEEIIFWFALRDIAGRTDESRIEELTVDTTTPVVNSFDYEIAGRSLNFMIGIAEENFDAVQFIDYKERTPRYRTLCSKLHNSVCEKKKFFTRGDHLIDIRVLDKAGNEAIAAEGIEFTA